ncbi:hypothetical protein GQ457_03G007940 [Hibiscus cannabinus]
MTRFEEGRSISCPLLFEGDAYSQWSNVMKYFILAQDFELWEIIEEGYIEAPKKKKKQRSENDTKAKLNSRAMHILLCGLNEEVSKKVSTCKRAKEMWEKLERLYVKEEKKDGAPSCANLLQSSKVDGVVALNEPKVSSNSSELDSYSFDELQDAFDELFLEFETMNSKFKKMISKLECENDFLLKTKLDFENQNHGHSLHTCPIKKRKSYRIRQVWVPKGTRDIEINVNGSKAIWIPKSK